MLWLPTNKLVGQVLSRFHSAGQRLDEMTEAFLGVGPRSSRGTGTKRGRDFEPAPQVKSKRLISDLDVIVELVDLPRNPVQPPAECRLGRMLTNWQS